MSHIVRRISEQELIVPVIEILIKSSNFKSKTSVIRSYIESIFTISGKDAEVINGQTRFSQKIRNLVSNRKKGRNMVHLRLADYVPHPTKQNQGSLALRVESLDLLESMGVKISERLRLSVQTAQNLREPPPPPVRRPRKPKID